MLYQACGWAVHSEGRNSGGDESKGSGMKAFNLLPLLLLLTTTAWGQSAVKADTPPGVNVIKFSWSDRSYSPDWDRPPFGATEQVLEDPRSLPSRDPNTTQLPTPNGQPPQPRGRDRATNENKKIKTVRDTQAPDAEAATRGGRVSRYEYKTTIKNVSEQTIEGVEWEYVFLDREHETELARHRFRTLRRAGPGKTVTLSETSLAPPTRVIRGANSDSKGARFGERIVIRCVAYSDGTVRWARTRDDCDGLRKQERAER